MTLNRYFLDNATFNIVGSDSAPVVTGTRVGSWGSVVCRVVENEPGRNIYNIHPNSAHYGAVDCLITVRGWRSD